MHIKDYIRIELIKLRARKRACEKFALNLTLQIETKLLEAEIEALESLLETL